MLQKMLFPAYLVVRKNCLLAEVANLGTWLFRLDALMLLEALHFLNLIAFGAKLVVV